MSAIVCDASAMVEYLLRSDTGSAVAEIIEGREPEVHVPALCDIEVTSALRRMLRDAGSVLTLARAEQAIGVLLDLPLTRHTHESLVAPAFALRDSLTIYAAVYVVLAEALGARLVTSDRSLASIAEERGLHVTALRAV